jgi:hypothetical protein
MNSPTFPNSPLNGQISGLALLAPFLPPKTSSVIRQLNDLLDSPIDKPEVLRVLQVACVAVIAYGSTLNKPSQIFVEIENRVTALKNALDVCKYTFAQTPVAAAPLYRRLSRHPAWALCIAVHALAPTENHKVFEAIGAEICLCLATAKLFRKAYATAIRRPFTHWMDELPEAAIEYDWHQTYGQIRRVAAGFFESDGAPDPAPGELVRLFDLRAKLQLHRKSLYAAPRRRQAVLDRGTQTVAQFQDSALDLMKRANAGDPSAILVLLACFSGLTLQVAIDLPIFNGVMTERRVIAIDIQSGTIHTDLEAVAAKSASPKAGQECTRTAVRVLVKPMPQFLAACLRLLFAKNPAAVSLVELIPDARTSGRELTLPHDPSPIKPSVARFITSASPIAIAQGADRLSTALIFNNFAVVPRSKLYYFTISREELWECSDHVFAQFGWGNSVPLLVGAPVGSRIVPTRAALAEWYSWMLREVESQAPGRHCSQRRLIEFHNAYSRACASLVVFCLAAREVKKLRFTTLNLHPDATECAFNDKWVGFFPGNLPVPITALIRAQVRLWLKHCNAMRRRLNKLPDPNARFLIRHLESMLAGNECDLFFSIETASLLPTPLGSKHLTRWWPDHLRFDADFGRHFWESELHAAGLKSTHIDVLLRHVIEGVAPQTSVSHETKNNINQQLSQAQDQILMQLGISAIRGLSFK